MNLVPSEDSPDLNFSDVRHFTGPESSVGDQGSVTVLVLRAPEGRGPITARGIALPIH